MKYADYITGIEIDSLWNGHRHIRWELEPGVNILSGMNGMGKSTILHRIESGVKDVREALNAGVRICTEPADAHLIRYAFLHTPDTRIEYDEALEALQERFAGYRNRQGREAFADMVEDYLSATEKTVARSSSGPLKLWQWGAPLDTRLLSSGEKQLLIILLTVLLMQGEPCVLLMDEPEVSLHIDWQKKLLRSIVSLNPKAQIILTTHSPAMIMDGWMDCVTDVEEIVCPD